MFNKGNLEHLNRRDRRSNRDGNNSEIKESPRKILYRALNLKDEDKKTTLMVIDAILDQALFMNTNGAAGFIIKEVVMPILIEKELATFKQKEAIINYSRFQKSTINKIRNFGLESIKNDYLVRKTRNFIILPLCRYLNNFDEFEKMNDCKNKIIEVFDTVGFQYEVSEIHRILKSYYDSETNQIIERKSLIDFKDSDLNICIKILTHIASLNNHSIDIENLLPIEKREVKKSEEEAKKRFEIIEIKDNEVVKDLENNIETTESKEDISPVATQLFKEVEENQVIEDIKENQIVEDLKFENGMLNSQLEDLRNEIKILQKEKEDGLIYLATQYQEGIKDVLTALNDPAYGFMLDKLYMLSKGKVDAINPKLLGTNILSALQGIGIRAIESKKIGEKIKLSEENIYDFKINKGIDSYENIEATIASPAWFYKREKVIKQLINIEEC